MAWGAFNSVAAAECLNILEYPRVRALPDKPNVMVARLSLYTKETLSGSRAEDA